MKNWEEKQVMVWSISPVDDIRCWYVVKDKTLFTLYNTLHKYSYTLFVHDYPTWVDFRQPEQLICCIDIATNRIERVLSLLGLPNIPLVKEV